MPPKNWIITAPGADWRAFPRPKSQYASSTPNPGPLRKLSAGDRLVKPVLTARQYGIGTPNLLLGIGAALHYDNPEDPQSVEMIAMTARLGAAAAVAEIAELPAGDPLPALAAQAYAEVERIIR